MTIVAMDSGAQDVFTLDSGLLSTTEDIGTYQIRVLRQNPVLGAQAIIGLQTVPGDPPQGAQPGTHYQSLAFLAANPITFAAGETSKNISLTILNAGIGAGNSRALTIELVALTGQTAFGAHESAELIINGAGTVVMAGNLSLEFSTYVLPESATYTTTVRVVRLNGSDGASNWRVVSSNGTGTAGTHYTAVDQSGSFGAGDTTPKNISVTVAAVAGDKSFTLSLIDVTNSSAGPITSAAVTIQDTTPSTLEFPRTAHVQFSNISDMALSSWQDGVAHCDLVVLRWFRGASHAYETTTSALKSRNAAMKVGADVQIVVISSTSTGDSTVRTYMLGRDGLLGITDTWFEQNAAGTRLLEGTNWFTLMSDECQNDVDGNNAAEYLMKNSADILLHATTGVARTLDFLLGWDDWPLERSGLPGVWQNNNNVDASATDPSRNAAWRRGWRDARAKLKALYPSILYVGRSGKYLTDQPITGDLSNDNDAWNGERDGCFIEDGSGAAGGISGLTVNGCSMDLNLGGLSVIQKFAQLVAYLQSAYLVPGRFTTNPPLNVVEWKLPASTCFASADPTVVDNCYRYARFLFCVGLACSDHYQRMTHYNNQNVAFRLDEMFGGITHTVANAKWLGTPLDPPQPAGNGTTAIQRGYEKAGVRRRVIVWPYGIGTTPTNATLPIPQSGKKWQYIGTGAAPTQRPAINTGADVSGGTIQRACYDAVIIQEVSV